MMVLKLSFPVILIDEVLKFVARTYLEGKLKLGHFYFNTCVFYSITVVIVAHFVYTNTDMIK